MKEPNTLYRVLTCSSLYLVLVEREPSYAGPGADPGSTTGRDARVQPTLGLREYEQTGPEPLPDDVALRHLLLRIANSSGFVARSRDEREQRSRLRLSERFPCPSLSLRHHLRGRRTSQDGSTVVALRIIATDGEAVLAMQAHLLRDDDNDQVLRDVIVTQLVEAVGNSKKTLR